MLTSMPRASLRASCLESFHAPISQPFLKFVPIIIPAGFVSPDNLLQIFILNRSRLSNGTTLTSSLSGTIAGLARSTNTLANSRLNIQAHYDISNDMFAAFLSPDMTYSCPIWATPASPGSSSRKSSAPEETLEHAQQTKLAYFIAQARLKRSDHVLEIGTGWGSFAIAAVRATGCRVTSITLSVEQKALAEQRIADAGFTDNIEVLLCDYRALPTPKAGRYDKIVSIEMLEAVGAEFLHTYFECVHKLLKPDGGIAVFQCITMPETVSALFSTSLPLLHPCYIPATLTPLLFFSRFPALRGLPIVDRLHPPLHLPRRPPAHRVAARRNHGVGLGRCAHRGRRAQHRAALRAHAAGVARGLQWRVGGAHPPGAAARPRRHDRRRRGALSPQVGVLLCLLRGRLRDVHAWGRHHHGGQGGRHGAGRGCDAVGQDVLGMCMGAWWWGLGEGVCMRRAGGRIDRPAGRLAFWDREARPGSCCPSGEMR